MTRTIKTSEIWQILRSRIPRDVLISTRIDDLQVQRQSELYDQAVIWLTGLIEARGAVATAKKFLDNNCPNIRLIDMPAYELWSRRVFSHLRRNPSTAQTLIQEDFNQFVSWNCKADILKALARLQGVIME